MMWSSTSVDLHDDFEGSQKEHCIFTEVFFGKDTGGKSKICLITECTNYENSKTVDAVPCANSENSALTTQSSSKSILVDDFDMKNNSVDGSVCGSSPESFDLAQGDDQHKSIKRRKLTTEVVEVKRSTSTLMSNKSVVVMPNGDKDSINQLVKLCLVELSHQGVCSSYYTLNCGVKIESKADADVADLRCKMTHLDVIGGMEIVVGETGGSPVSKESHERNLFVPSPSAAILDIHEYPLPVEEGPESFDTPELDVSNTFTIDFKKDPRQFLQSHVNRLLTAAGWSLFKHRRPCRSYFENLYQSPAGKNFRDFPKVWKSCGQTLCADKYHLVPEDCGKEWTGISQFWSDLADAMMKLEKELEQLNLADSLAHWWFVLDPFVNVVFVQRKVGYMRRGNTVKAKRTLVVDSKGNDSLLALANAEELPADTDLLGDSLVKDENVSMDIALCQDEPYSTKFDSSDIQQQFKKGEDEHYLDVSRFERRDRLDFTLKKKQRRKSRKIAELRTIRSNQNDDTAVNGDLVELNAVEDKNFTSGKAKSRESLAEGNCLHHLEKNRLKLKTGPCTTVNLKNEQMTCTKCEIKDDDLLVSALLKGKDFSPGACRSTLKRTSSKPRGRSKLKGKRGKRRCCRLLPRCTAKVGKCHMNAKWSMIGPRTVLSWLIHAEVISVDDVIQFRDQDDGTVIKGGLVTRDGIMCKCCNVVFSVSKFKTHAGFKLSCPCLNLFTDYGKPLTLCQLQAWSDEYKTRKSRTKVVRTEEDDQNDDSCGVCGDVGELVCCDNCPSTFHQACLQAKELPEGNWYCRQCTCWICGDLANDKDGSLDAFKCSQCEHKYHDSCQKKKSSSDPAYSDNWFCGRSCEEVYVGLHSRIGISNLTANGFCWTLLRCIHEDPKVHTPQRLALKAECNSKLVVALTIMEECFQSMVDRRTGIDMIPHALYNLGSEFARLNYQGFYTAILEKDDVLISVASIRVHGTQVAEMPLIATCSKFRREGMCRRLISAIEKMLMSVKVEKLVISAIPELVSTWTKGFGFVPVSDEEKRTLSKINLMVFPGTVLLKKSLYEAKEAGIYDARKLVAHPGEDCSDDIVRRSVRNSCTDKINEISGSNLDERQSMSDVEEHLSHAASKLVKSSHGAKIRSNSPLLTNPSSVTRISSSEDPIGSSADLSNEKNSGDEGAVESGKGKSDGRKMLEQFSKASCIESVAAAIGITQSEVSSCCMKSVTAEPSLARQPQQV